MRFRIIEAGDATPGRGRNAGIAVALNDWIALTDAGIRLESTWLERLSEQLDRDLELDVVYGNYEPVLSSRFGRAAALAYVAPKQIRMGGLMRGPSIASCLLRKTVWQAVGGFPDLRAAEDLVFMEQISSRGFRIGWAPGATVWWQLQPSLSRTFRRFALYSKHNVWAGRQIHWHYGVARQYLLALPFLVLGVSYNSWWLAPPAIGFICRVAKSIWIRREGRGLIWFLNPLQFFGVAMILAVIDAATFIGWLQALRYDPPPQQSDSAAGALPEVVSPR